MHRISPHLAVESIRYPPRMSKTVLLSLFHIRWCAFIAFTAAEDHLSIYIADLFATPFDPRNQVDADDAPCILANGCPGRVLDDTTFDTDYNTLVRRSAPARVPHTLALRINGLWPKSCTVHSV